MPIIHGIHHITAIAADPQQTYDFYTKVLGLRLVKKSVNQDDVATYHLFFGDTVGSPGMDLTFFTFQPAHQGKRGAGLVTTIALAVPKSSLKFWQQRFTKLGIKHEAITTVFEQQRLVFYDHDDQRLELVAAATTTSDLENVWTTDEITAKVAIRSFYSATLSVPDRLLIEPVLQLLGYELAAVGEVGLLYRLPGADKAAELIVDESLARVRAVQAAGTVHHIAFAVTDQAALLQLRTKLMAVGLYPTQIIDRYYFQSVYFRVPAGILFELATEGPGFAADEPVETLGEKLALPPFLEHARSEIEAGLQPIKP